MGRVFVSIFVDRKRATFIVGLSERKRNQKMNDFYRGFEIERMRGGIFQIRENGKLIDDASTETLAYNRIDNILKDRRCEAVDLRR